MEASTMLLLAGAAIMVGAALKRFLSGPSSLPPGSIGLPLIGETLRLISVYRTTNPEPFIDERVARYGTVFTTHVFGERTVFSADPAFNRLILNADGRIVHSSYPSSIATLLGANSMLLTHGPAHKRLYSLTISQMGRPALPPLLAHIEHLILVTMQQWEPAASVRLTDEVRKITFNLTVKQLVSMEPGPWSESLRREYVKVLNGFLSIPFPFASLLPFTTYGQALKARNKVAEALREVIRNRMDEKMTGKYQENREKDMVDVLLEADDAAFSEEQMVDFCVALLVAGYETTSVTMTLAVKFLTETPAALAQLREEHDSIRNKKGKNLSLDWSDYQSMMFTQCVINETLRLANFASGVFRRAITDIHFKDYVIPKGCKIFASFRAVHLNNEYYNNARTFNPWRWQSKKVQNVEGANLFTPFGGGPRQCPGYELARVVMSVFLHHMVTRFSWEEAENDRLVFFPTTRVVKGYPINLQLRSDSLLT